MVDTLGYIAANSPWWMHIIHALGGFFPWIIVVILIVLVAISVFGNIGVDWKEKKFTFGHLEQHDQLPIQQQTQKRSCADCIMLILGKRTIFESTYHTLLSRILRDQMTYAEHKIQEAKYFLLQSYQTDIEYFRHGDPDLIRENKEYIIYQETISNALENVKDEIRRSFRENGFHTLEDSEFKSYVKERIQTLITIVRDYLRRTYPTSGMIVPLSDRFKKLDTRGIDEIEAIISDLYVNAKNVRSKIEDEIKSLESCFISDIDSLVGDKNAIVQQNIGG